MFGDVVTGKYEIGINSWLWNKDRNEVVDFVVPNYIYRTILCYIPKPPEVDHWLVIRPFTNAVWLGIGCTLCLGLAAFFFPYFLINDWGNMNANSIIKFSLWFFFVLINAYYGGALTMFFASENSFSFKTLRDVLQAFPEWNLIISDGLTVFLKAPAYQVNKSYNFITSYPFLPHHYIDFT